MLISRRHNFVYLANPKTGTTSIEVSFRQYADFGSVGPSLSKHINYRQFTRMFSYFAKNYEIVVCVRDPIESLYSWYRYRQRDSIKIEENRTSNVTFLEFLNAWNEESPPPFAKVSSSVEFILDPDGNIPDISIFKYGEKPSVHDYLARKIGKDIPEKTINVSPKDGDVDLNSIRDAVGISLPKLNRSYDVYNKIQFVNSKHS